MSYSSATLLVDFAYASAFLLVGKFLRTRVRFFQEFFVPSSLIAGFLGLILGPNGFNLVQFSREMGAYSGLLIILVFVSVGLRGFDFSVRRWRQDIERIGSYMCFREIAYMSQYTLPMVFAYYILSPVFSGLHPGFGMTLGAGFIGGHGTAAAIGNTFAKYGWADATDLAMTSATIGILTGVFGGVILIRWAARNGITRYIKDYGNLPDELRTGLIPAGIRGDIGKETVSPLSIDPLVWHFALVLVPSGIGYLLAGFIAKQWGLNVPSFSVGFLVAVLMYYMLSLIGANKYVDDKVISRIGSSATDFLVFFGIAAIRLPVVVKYAAPFGLLIALGILLVVGVFLYFAPRLVRKDWFERGIFVYGYATGVYAIGFILLRIVDPDMRSRTLDDTAILSPFFVPVDLLVISTAPILLSTGRFWTMVGPAFAYLAFFLLLPRIMGWWYAKLPLARHDPPRD
ncbi:MAG: sodium:glutamate symporter [Firmicutes bacterium]|nr:sodium:glutamate symporter [Bacillota bacterium]